MFKGPVTSIEWIAALAPAFLLAWFFCSRPRRQLPPRRTA